MSWCAMRHERIDQIPPFAGGQVRTSAEIQRDGSISLVIFALLVLMPICWALGYYLRGVTG